MFRRSLTLMLVFLLLCVSAINARPPVITQPNSDRLLPKIEIKQIRTGRAPGNFTVNRTDDTIDVNLGDGICADSNGLCSIRAAVQESNALEPGSTISIPAAGTYFLTLDLHPTYETGLLVAQTMTLTGANAVQTQIHGNETAGVLVVDADNVVIENLTFTGGSGFDGMSGTVIGGVYNLGTNTLFRNVNIQTNYADDIGGFANETGASATFENSAIVDNHAMVGSVFDTGGIMVFDGSDLTLKNVTVSSNYSAGGIGGIRVAISGFLTLNNVTVAHNGSGVVGGIRVDSGGSVVMSNSILANNIAGTSPDCDSILVSTGDNLIGDTSGGCGGTSGDLTDVDPLLEPLIIADGDETATHALQELSPAIDAANDATCELVDQRFVSRPQREGCDIGAYELEALPPTATPTEGPSPTPTDSPAIELIENGDFETLDGEGKPDITPWIIKNASGEKGKCNKDKDGDGIPDKIVANTGNCAFQFKGNPGETSKLEQTLDLTGISFNAGDELTLTFAAQTKGGAGGKAKLVFKYIDDAKTKIAVTIGDTGEVYVPFSGSETLIGGNVASSKLNIKLNSQVGKLYVDGVSLRLVSAGDGTSETPAARLNGSQ